jgi:hypothetical protein
MPEQRRVVVRYWGICRGWLGIPYPCRKTREETRWCYTFSLAVHRCLGAVEQFKACENGTEYHYRTWCFGVAWSWAIITTPYERCFKDRLDEKGPCSVTGDFPSTPVIE